MKKKKRLNLIRPFAIAAAFFALAGCGLSAGLALAQGWSEPISLPPLGNAYPPIWNQSVSAQAGNFWVSGVGKLGSLSLVGSSSGTVTVQPAAAAGTWSLTLPTSAGTNGQVLTTNGSGVTSWTTASGGGYWAASGSNIYNSNSGNVGIGTNNPGYKLDVAGGIRATGALYANANGAPYLCGGDDACFNDINIANTVGIYGAQDAAQGAIKLGSNGGTISGINGAVKINGKDVCLADGTNCGKVAVYGTKAIPTYASGSECVLTYNNGGGMLLGLPLDFAAVRTGKVRVTVNGILRNNSATAITTSVKLSAVSQGYGCGTGAQTSSPIASSKGVYTANSSDRRVFETFAIYDVTAGSTYHFDLAVFPPSGTTAGFSALEYSAEEL